MTGQSSRACRRRSYSDCPMVSASSTLVLDCWDFFCLRGVDEVMSEYSYEVCRIDMLSRCRIQVHIEENRNRGGCKQKKCTWTRDI